MFQPKTILFVFTYLVAGLSVLSTLPFYLCEFGFCRYAAPFAVVMYSFVICPLVLGLIGFLLIWLARGFHRLMGGWLMLFTIHWLADFTSAGLTL